MTLTQVAFMMTIAELESLWRWYEEQGLEELFTSRFLPPKAFINNDTTVKQSNHMALPAPLLPPKPHKTPMSNQPIHHPTAKNLQALDRLSFDAGSNPTTQLKDLPFLDQPPYDPAGLKNPENLEKKVLFPSSPCAPSGVSNLEELTNLEDLKKHMKDLDCPLKPLANKMVFSDGISTSKIMIIGEAPGADEDRLGKPFVGISGQLLDRMLTYIGLRRTHNIYIANILPWRPPGNRAPTSQETELYLPCVERHIYLIQPRVLVCVGATAARTLLRSGLGISKLQGQFTPYKNPYMEEPIPCFSLFHPAYLLRSPGQKSVTWRNLLILKAFLEKNNLT
jgi:uracil-DNA glycosylase family 4